MYFYEVSKFMHNVYHGRNPNAFGNYFQPIIHSYNTRTRQQQTYNLPQPRTERGKRSLRYHGVEIWSQVPEHKKSLNAKQFKYKMKEYILENM